MQLRDVPLLDSSSPVPQAPVLTPLITVIVPVRNGSESLDRCLEAVFASDYPRFECIVVDDGSTDATPAIARRHGAKVLPLTSGPHGPAFARNRGAEVARGEMLFFVDADVVIHRDALERIASVFAHESEAAAVFGSYDETPGAKNLISQYKNLAHHFVHQEGREEGTTFWSGCGAVRRDVFLALGGFDQVRYSRPSIEDIDLGCRWRAAGQRILLDKGVQATHLKRWTLRGMIASDLFDRALPWTLLILRERNLPNDLNLRLSQRVSALLVYALLIGLAVGAVIDVSTLALPLLGALLLLVAGHWGWPEGVPSLTSRKALWLSYPLIGLTAVLMLTSGHAIALLPLVPLVVSAIAGPRLPWIGPIWAGHLFAVVVLGVTAALAIVLLSCPMWLVALTVSALGLILLLNFRFFAFCARQRGLIFALAVFPIQLLYYLYSVLAFAFGTVLHLKDTLAARRNPQNQSIRRST